MGNRPSEQNRKASIDALVKGAMNHARLKGEAVPVEKRVREEITKIAERADRKREW